ncbi:LLM class flavin-dependent oxidoreductase [Sphingobacterium faecium]|uniref:LLM class flavin-dependent oxidoreductase n=1 Tax=Sphingobacterium faecium TaxID=34087 RepID=UPI003208F697
MQRKIGILDFGYYHPDQNNSIELLNFTFDFVKRLDEQGFSRYWMAEHYNDFCSWTNPEILLTVLAGMTESINIGAAGVLIYFHQPFHVATSFKMIACLFPERIDLGLARGNIQPHMVKHLTGNSKISIRALKNNEKDLLNYLFNNKLYDRNGQIVPLPPYGGSLPNPWTLGSSTKSALNSISLNTNFSLSLFHENKDLGSFHKVWLEYNEEKNKANANHLAGNVAIQYTSISDVKKLKLFAEENKVSYNDKNSVRIIGEPNYCEDKLNQYFELFGAEEFIIQDISRDFNQKNETIENLLKFI